MNEIDTLASSIYSISRWRPAAYKQRVLDRAVMQIFRYWSIEPGNQLQLLGLPRYRRRLLHRLQMGAAEPLNPIAKLMMRKILRLYGLLMLSYPSNPEMRKAWFHSSHKALRGKSPFQVVSACGVQGWFEIERLLYG